MKNLAVNLPSMLTYIYIHYIYFINCYKKTYIFRTYAQWVRLGDLDYISETDEARPKDYKIVERIVHPNYKPPSLYNDIALFRLERDVEFSAFVRPICLNTDHSLRPPAIIATGWGRTDTGKFVFLFNI